MSAIRIAFSEQEAHDLAERYFVKYCGLDFAKEKHSRMYREAMEVRANGIGGIRLNALVASFGPEIFSNHKVTVSGHEISCRAFEQIPDDNVQKVFLYMITAGECACDPKDTITKQLFADIWGTVYVDAGRDLLEDAVRIYAEEEISANPGRKGYLSFPFSPGFFGMKTEESKTISSILGGSEIGISVRDNGVMVPIKTCSGLYLVVSDPAVLPIPRCRTCIGNEKGCIFCKVMMEKTAARGESKHEQTVED